MTKTNQKPRIFSGIQPSGNLHIGNYLGAITQWVEMQAEYNCIFCVVDYHAITVPQKPEVLRAKIMETAKIYLAAGIDPKRSIIFQQSDISAHTELCWIFNTITQNGDLTKMTQFKDKAGVDFNSLEKGLSDSWNEKIFNSGLIKKIEKEKDISLALNSAHEVIWDFVQSFKLQFNKVGVGLFDYPVLMAADILLYNTDVVPVGDDQTQHVELARDIAKRFNNRFGEIFKVPEVKIKKEGARIMGLDNPEKKMSKSAASDANYVALTDEPDKAAKKIMRAVTDTGKDILYDKENKPGITNLISIYSNLTETPVRDIEKKYKRKGYGDFKKDLAEIVKKFLADFQKKYNAISDKDVRRILNEGADQARPIAEETLRKVKEKIGIK